VNWDDLHVFLAVARAGRISAAARRLDVEHTTVSRRLTALEAELGLPLFYRTTTGCLLTPHGRALVPSAESMERAALAAAARAREASGAVTGRVRVALAPEFASDWLAPKLPAFLQAHPQIELQVLVGTGRRDLSRGEVELSVASPRPEQQGLVAVRLARTTAGLYATKALVPGGRVRITGVESLRDLPLAAYISSYQMLQAEKWFQPLLGSANVVLTSNSTHTLLAAARAGACVAVLPRFVARRYGELVAVSDPVSTGDIWLATHPEFRRDPKVRAVADFLTEIAGGPDGLC
jgi:DNA-binding transcriptional LysR family regulator